MHRRRSPERGACRADDVERAGDEHEVVGFGRSSRPRATASRTDGQDLGGDAEAAGGGGHDLRAGRARGDGGGQATTSRARRASSASSISTGSRPRSMPTTRIRPADDANSSSSVAGAGARARRVVGAVEHDEGPAPDDLEPPGSWTAANASATTSASSGHAEERLDRGERDGGVVALVGAVQRQEDVVVGRAGRAQVEQPAADGEPVLRRTEVLVAQPHASRLGRAEDRDAARDRSRRARACCPA